jgi:hypothetical protein
MLLSYLRVKKKLAKDREMEEAEQESHEEEYEKLYGTGFSRAEDEKPPDSSLYEEGMAAPAKLHRPGAKVKEVHVVKHRMRSKMKEPKEDIGEVLKPPAKPASPMRYGYKLKKQDNGIPVRDIPTVRGARMVKPQDRIKRRGAKPKRDGHKIEWD